MCEIIEAVLIYFVDHFFCLTKLFDGVENAFVVLGFNLKIDSILEYRSKHFRESACELINIHS